MNLFHFILLLGLIASAKLAPIGTDNDDFCDGNLLKYDPATTYLYNYETNSLLWINDVSDEAKSNLKLSAKVSVRPKGKCSFVLRLEDVTLSGESLTDADKTSAANALTADTALFRLNKNGELDSQVKFSTADDLWTRNVKRGIISAFQVKAKDDLRRADPSDSASDLSAVVYENDVLGRCRTTYKLEGEGASYKLKKSKSLGRCTLNENRKSSPIQFVPYKSLPEFIQGKLFNEEYECESSVEDGIVKSVECKETSTFKIGSRGSNGVQAVVKQKLSLDKTTNVQDRRADNTDSYPAFRIAFEADEDSQTLLENKNFNADKFLTDLCANAAKSGLELNHATNFKDLVITVRSYKKDQLLDLYEKSNAKCSLAGLTAVQAILFSGTEDSFDAVFSLLDQNKSFPSQKGINEYPVLTVLTRIQDPSKELINKINAYLKGKNASFPYLRKLFLVYSAIIRNYCQNKEGSCRAEAENWSEIFAPYLGADCSDAATTDVISTALKAIGNIGYFKQTNVLEACAAKTSNRAAIRVNAIQAFRDFECSDLQNLNGNFDILKNKQEDAELRITAFRALMKCPASPRMLELIKADFLKKFLKEEEDSQVFTYIIDFGRERGLTGILNTVLADPEINEKFSVNFREQSWNNYKYKYSVLRDGAVELDTSVIYTSRTWIPRSVNFNVTVHLHGMSVNLLDATVRMEGMDEGIKAAFVDKLTSAKILERIMEKPEQLVDILNSLASKLQFSAEKPYLSLSLKVYGADVFYSELDSGEEIKQFFEGMRDPKKSGLYATKNDIRNMFLFDTHVQQPLLNGFEFSARLDTALSALAVGSGNRDEAADKSVKFNFNNLFSGSINVNRRYEVRLCPHNKLSLKKNAQFNWRLRLDVDGNRSKGKTALYNINLTPLKSIPIVTIDARFYKLSTGGEYVEVKNFKIEQTQFKNCTSLNFRSATGVDLCLAFNRPSFASLKELLSPADLESIPRDDDEDNDDNDKDDDDDDDEDDNIDKPASRPRGILSGPYHYEISIANPDLIKTLVLEAQLEKEDDEIDFKAKLSTKSAADKLEDRVEWTYKRERKVTNRGLTRSFDWTIKNIKTGESRLNVAGRFVYKKEEELSVLFKVDNKILREFLYSFEVSRTKKEDNMAPSYKIESVFDSKITDSPKQFRLILDSICEQKDIKANLLLELSGPSTGFQQFKVFDGIIELKSNNDENDNIDHELSVHFETFSGRVIELHGPINFETLKSNVDLAFKHTKDGREFELNLKSGHSIDLSEGGKSSVEFLINAPSRNVNHGLKVLADLDVTNQRINGLELHVSTPRTLGKEPYVIEISRSSTFNEEDPSAPYNKRFYLALRNLNLDLSSQQNFAIKLINRIGDTPVVQTAELEIVVDRERLRKFETSLTLKKNTLPVLNIKANAYGNIRELRKTEVAEFPKQELGASLEFKFISYAGNGKATLVLERSDKKNLHNYSFNFKAEKFLKAIVGIGEINFAHNSEPGKFNAQFDITKDGDVKSISIKSTSPLRVGGDVTINGLSHKQLEYDVAYEKTLASTEVLKATGVMKVKFNSFKNFDAELNMDKNFAVKIASANQRDAADLESALGNLHVVEFGYKHVDFSPVEKLYKLALSKQIVGSAKKVSAEFNVKKGIPSLADPASIEYNLHIKTKADIANDNIYFMGYPRIQDRTTSIVLVSKKYKLDSKLDADYKYDTAAGFVTYNEKFSAQFPVEGKINDLKTELNFKRSLDYKTANIRIKRSSELPISGARIYKSFDVNYQRTTVDGKAVNIKLDAELAKRPDSDRALPKVDTVNVDLSTSCVVSNCDSYVLKVKQTVYPVHIMRFLEPGRELDLSDCTYERKSSTTEVDIDLSVRCGKKLIVAEKIVSKHWRDTLTNLPSGRLEARLSSDFKVLNSHIKLDHDKFNKKNGLFRLSYGFMGQDSSNATVSYKRELDDTTGRLVRGTYEVALALDNQSYKRCEMKIESKTDYYNVVNCVLSSPRVPIPLNYGYSLKIAKLEDYVLFGKRNLDLNVQLPTGRLLRAVYTSVRDTPVDGKPFDEDGDDNDYKEFKSNVKLFWDAKRDEKKYIEFNVKRDNVAPGKTVLSFDVLNHPHFKTLNLQYIKERKFEETDINAVVQYELLKNGAKNRLDLILKMSSVLDTSAYSVELNLQRPSLNALYENRFDKNNGRLKYLSVRLHKLLRLVVDKEYDPDNRSIALELNSPDDSKFTVNTVKSRQGDVIVSTSTLSSTAGAKLSVLTSKFDTRNNRLEVNINGVATNSQYNLNLGVFSEKVANAYLTDGSKKILGEAFLYVTDSDYEGTKDLVFELKWNRLWGKIQKDLVGGQELENSAKPSAEFNSFFGDVYAQLKGELQEAYTDTRKTRKEVFDDIGKLILLQLEFYSKLFPSLRNSETLKAYAAAQTTESGENVENLPLQKRIYVKYNQLADKLTKISIGLRKYSKGLSRAVPRLPKINFDLDDGEFKNNLKIVRPTLNAQNLYQFNAEYHDYVRRLGQEILDYKGDTLIRNKPATTFKAIINKYKLRSLKDHTLVASVYNGRNLVGFNGESKLLATPCNYLLAHDAGKNRFSVLLNNKQSGEPVLNLVLAGAKPVTVAINAKQITVDGAAVSLPKTIALNNNNEVTLFKGEGALVAVFNRDAAVACYEDSNSCTLSFTRFFVGRLKGFLGGAEHNELAKLPNEADWMVEQCPQTRNIPKPPTDEAIRKCYAYFGRHPLSPLRDAFLVVDPSGWQKVCERALTADPNSKCAILSAYVRHARIESVDVNLPTECFSCKNKNLGKSYSLDAFIPKEEATQDKFDKGNDYVFLMLPCESAKYSLDYANLLKQKGFLKAEDRFAIVKVDKHGASIVQSSKQEIFNYDLASVASSLAVKETSEVELTSFLKGLFLAESLFAKRVSQSRHLVIKSCGNCPDYSIGLSLAMGRAVSELGVTVSSIGDYDITTGEESDDSTPIGYDEDKLYSAKASGEVESDSLESYKVDHKADLCQRLAVKSHGLVLNVNKFRDAKLLAKLPSWLEAIGSHHSLRASVCERVDTPLGDLADFRFIKTEA